MNDLPVAPAVTLSVSQWSDRQKAVAQRKFLDEHHDMISPWRFPIPVRVQRDAARLVTGWRACAERVNGDQ